MRGKRALFGSILEIAIRMSRPLRVNAVNKIYRKLGSYRNRNKKGWLPVIYPYSLIKDHPHTGKEVTPVLGLYYSRFKQREDIVVDADFGGHFFICWSENEQVL